MNMVFLCTTIFISDCSPTWELKTSHLHAHPSSLIQMLFCKAFSQKLNEHIYIYICICICICICYEHNIISFWIIYLFSVVSLLFTLFGVDQTFSLVWLILTDINTLLILQAHQTTRSSSKWTVVQSVTGWNIVPWQVVSWILFSTSHFSSNYVEQLVEANTYLQICKSTTTEMMHTVTFDKVRKRKKKPLLWRIKDVFLEHMYVNAYAIALC